MRVSGRDDDVIARDSGLLLDAFTDFDSEIRGDGDQIADDEGSGKLPLSEDDGFGFEGIFGSGRKPFAIVAADRIIRAGCYVGRGHADVEFFGGEKGSGRDKDGEE